MLFKGQGHILKSRHTLTRWQHLYVSSQVDVCQHQCAGFHIEQWRQAFWHKLCVTRVLPFSP